MSILLFLRPTAVAVPVLPYYQAERPTPAVLRLRPLTALEQKYAYWGSDRV